MKMKAKSSATKEPYIRPFGAVQLAKASSTFRKYSCPAVKKPPVYSRPLTQETISTMTGTTRSATLPLAEFLLSSSAPSKGRSGVV